MKRGWRGRRKKTRGSVREVEKERKKDNAKIERGKDLNISTRDTSCLKTS